MLSSFPTSMERLPRWAAPQQYGRYDRLIIGGLCAFFVFSWISFIHQSMPHFSTSLLAEHPITNSTLGFEKVYALALPGRDDRTQPLLDAANATNITLTVLNAVKDSEIDEADYPKGWKHEHHREGELGCLASHVRTWNLMVANNITSALVLESDADWDLRIKDIMQPLATGIRTLVDWPFTIEHQNIDPRVSPYGDSWDIVWIGHCGSNHDGNIRAYAWNDTSVPPESHEYVFDTGLTGEQHVPGTRTVYQFGRTTCSTGYMISNQGAKKLVEYFKDTDDNMDIKLSSVCSQRPDMTCLGVWPQIITAANTKSNIDHSGSGDETSPDPEKDEVEAGPALQYSARVNAAQIIETGGFALRKDWIGEWDTCWAVNPAKNGTWDMMKVNQTNGEPIVEKVNHKHDGDEETHQKSNSRVEAVPSLELHSAISCYLTKISIYDDSSFYTFIRDDFMNFYMPPPGSIMLYPVITDRAFVSMSPLNFVNKLIVANPELLCRNMTVENIKFTFMGMMIFKKLEQSQYPDVRTQRVGLLERWESSPDWKILEYLLDPEPTSLPSQTFVPYGNTADPRNTFTFGPQELFLPSMSDDLFSADGLNIERFIEALRLSNTTKQGREGLLSLDVVRAAMDEFALRMFPNAARGVREHFAAQLQRQSGVRALNDHSRWLANPQKRQEVPMGKSCPRQYSSTMASAALSAHRAPSFGVKASKVSGSLSVFSSEGASKKDHKTDLGMSHIPKIQFVDNAQRSRLLSRDCALHVSLAAQSHDSGRLKPTETHLHYMNNTSQSGGQKLEVQLSYDRAIFVEFENRKLRDLGAKRIASKKFSYGKEVLHSVVEIFAGAENTRDTKWSLYCAKNETKYSLHEALRRFLCLQGAVPNSHITVNRSGHLGEARLHVKCSTSPSWLSKLVGDGREEAIYEVRHAATCELCAHKSLVTKPQIAATDASTPMTMQDGQVPDLGVNVSLASTVDTLKHSYGLRSHDKVAVNSPNAPHGQTAPPRSSETAPTGGDDEIYAASSTTRPLQVQLKPQDLALLKRKASDDHASDEEAGEVKRCKSSEFESRVPEVKGEDAGEEVGQFLQSHVDELEAFKRRDQDGQ